MRVRVDASTDGAAICVFDPAALPETASVEDGERLQREGLAYLFETGGDGTFGIDVVIGPPRSAQSIAKAGPLRCPSGRIWICGAEYLARDPLRGGPGTPEGGLGRFAMGEAVEVPRGSYRCSLRRLRSGMSTLGQSSRSSSWPSALAIVGGLGVVVGVIGFVAQIAARLRKVADGASWSDLPWHSLPEVGLSVASALVLAFAFWLGGRADSAAARVRQEKPDFVLTLHPVETTAN